MFSKIPQTPVKVKHKGRLQEQEDKKKREIFLEFHDKSEDIKTNFIPQLQHSQIETKRIKRFQNRA